MVSFVQSSWGFPKFADTSNKWNPLGRSLFSPLRFMDLTNTDIVHNLATFNSHVWSFTPKALILFGKDPDVGLYFGPRVLKNLHLGLKSIQGATSQPNHWLRHHSLGLPTPVSTVCGSH
ncbi:hypothetical protein Sjap_015932 [Stephania japonica]|uniref:Uncharacterized protein n=1 Tax=Stephania japonica TaxID=461633 RepID=A0AAP0IKW3_9MAGN